MTASPALPFGRLIRLAVKEQKEILRDRRTLLTLIVMPVLLYPLVGLVIQQFLAAAPRNPIYLIGVPVAEHAQLVDQLAHLGETRTSARESKNAAPELQYVIEPIDDLRRRLRDGRIDVLVEVRGRLALRRDQPVAVDFDFLTVRGRKLSEGAGRFLRSKLELASKLLLASRLADLHVPQRPDPLRIDARNIDPSSRREGFPLASVAPFMLILMTITGAVYPAIDLTAGERERGTLEMLMAAPVPRMAILVAKYSAVLTVALLTALVNITAMAATLYLTDVGRLVVGEGGLTAKAIAQGFAALVLFVCFFSALLLALASFSRSFKEAQAYLIPLMLVALAPGVVSLFPGVELTPATAATPLLNIVLFARDLLSDGVDALTTGIVLVTNACYAAAALVLAARLFGSEGVLYGGPGSWSGIMRRPSSVRKSIPVPAAFLLIGLAVPGLLLLTGVSRLAFPNNYVGQSLAGAFVLMIVFVVAPSVTAYNRNVAVATAFSFKRPSVVSLLSAILLGASLWPFAIALMQWSAPAQALPNDPAVVERLTSFADEIRRLPLPASLILLAIVPAVCEELFFRGFLIGSLVARGAAVAVAITSLIFAAFHVLSPAGLTTSRFVPSLFLGFVLGLLRWRSASIWPGMLLHVAHNGVVIAATKVPGWFGFVVAPSGDLIIPRNLYVGAAVIASTGCALLMITGRRRSPGDAT